MTIADTVYEKLKTASPEVAQEVLAFLEMLEAKAKQRPSTLPPKTWDEFYNRRQGTKVFDGDPMEIQRQMREGWDRDDAS